MRRSWALIGALLLVYGALVILFPETTVSPGHLIKGHQEFAAKCFTCHAAFGGTPTNRCVKCHAIDAIGITTTLGAAIPGREGRPRFHQALLESNCTSCHTDHRGPHAATSLRTFSHELLAPPARSACADCHASRKPADDLHRLVSPTCGKCHGTAAWKPASFEHEKYFRFDRNHPASECRTCHPQRLQSYTCYGCHEHTPARVSEEHREEGIVDFQDCIRCHRSGDEHEAERGMRRERGGGQGDDD